MDKLDCTDEYVYSNCSALPFLNNTVRSSNINMPKLKLFIVLIYAFLSLAIIFNLRVIYIVIRILIKKQSRVRRDVNRHAFLYVLTLSIVDAIVLAHLPIVATDIMLSRWIFGHAMCKLYWIIEQINRILSTFTLTALSADRYLAICHPMRCFKWRTTFAATCVISFFILLASALVVPTFIYSNVVRWTVLNQTIDKCMFAMEADAMHRFLTYVFICGYCIPFVSMVFFYGSILRTLWRRHDRSIMQSIDDADAIDANGCLTCDVHGRQHRRAHQVTKKAFILVSFYFACWTPYWLIQFYIQFLLVENEMENHDSIIIAIYAVHVLVYVNSAVNPVLYALLNKELQRQHSSLQQKNGRDHVTIDSQHDQVIRRSNLHLNVAVGAALRDSTTVTPTTDVDAGSRSLEMNLVDTCGYKNV